MNDIIKLTEVDFSQVFIGIFTIMVGILALITILDKISDRIGVEFRWQRKKKENHELLMSTIRDLQELKEKQERDTKESVKHDEKIEEKIEKLTDMFIDKQISDLRFNILDFASAISLGRQYTKEQYDHVLSMHSSYEKILAENNMSNGQVELSMELINETYRNKLRNGF